VFIFFQIFVAFQSDRLDGGAVKRKIGGFAKGQGNAGNIHELQDNFLFHVDKIIFFPLNLE
jgi:hypothetical protein